MLVPAMTLEEVRREFEKDFEIIYRKAAYVSHKLEKTLSKTMKEKGYVRFFDYYSKYKNKWIYRVNITKKQDIVSFMMFYDSPKGHMTITATDGDYLIFHTGHFFERFNERCKLGLTSYKDIVCAFMDDCITYGFQPLEQIAPGVKKFFGIVPSGAVLGIQDENLHIYRINTFLSNDLLHHDQKEFQQQLNDTLNKYIQSSSFSKSLNTTSKHSETISNNPETISKDPKTTSKDLKTTSKHPKTISRDPKTTSKDLKTISNDPKTTSKFLKLLRKLLNALRLRSG
jgi:hypothetical protein